MLSNELKRVRGAHKKTGFFQSNNNESYMEKSKSYGTTINPHHQSCLMKCCVHYCSIILFSKYTKCRFVLAIRFHQKYKLFYIQHQGLGTYLPIYLSTYLPVYLSTYLPILSIYLIEAIY